MKRDEILVKIAEIKRQAVEDRSEETPVRIILNKGGALYGFYRHCIGGTLQLEIPLGQKGVTYHRTDPAEIAYIQYFPLKNALEELNKYSY